MAGKSFHSALDLCHYFPCRAKTMIAIGENADSLPFIMKKMACIYQQNLNDSLDRLSKLLEPVIMITVASLVSGLIIAMYLPIFKMGNVV
jgi:type IV pilus assembly protein PilC